MKKILLILLLLIPIGLLVSCSDDVENTVVENNAKITLTFNNVAVINGKIYTTQDYPMEVESVNVDSSDEIADVQYTIDGKNSTRSDHAPFAGRFDTRALSTGTHPLGISFDIIQPDNSEITDNMQYNFIIVPSVEDLPMDAQLGTFTQTFHIV